MSYNQEFAKMKCFLDVELSQLSAQRKSGDRTGYCKNYSPIIRRLEVLQPHLSKRTLVEVLLKKPSKFSILMEKYEKLIKMSCGYI